jgi:hypothetical protein
MRAGGEAGQGEIRMLGRRGLFAGVLAGLGLAAAPAEARRNRRCWYEWRRVRERDRRGRVYYRRVRVRVCY